MQLYCADCGAGIAAADVNLSTGLAKCATCNSLTYSVLTGFLNRTVVEVSDLILTIRHGPLPWWGNRELPRSQIEQLFCERTWARTNQNQCGPQYQLYATMGEGKKLRLLGGFRYLGEARFLEQQIERRLGIKPQAVVGECTE
jgi:hypothetical protein